MGVLIDNAISLRILYLLTQKFENTKAYKLGIIDLNGNPLRKLSDLHTQEEKDSYTMLHRLVFRLKKLLAIIPGGSSKIATLAAAYFLVREHYESSLDDIDDDKLLEFLKSNNNLINEEISIQKFLLCEDEGIASTNTTNIEKTQYPLGSVVRRKTVLDDLKKKKKNVKSDNA